MDHWLSVWLAAFPAVYRAMGALELGSAPGTHPGHRESNLWCHSVWAARMASGRETVVLAAFLHDVGKLLCAVSLGPRRAFPHHAVLGAWTVLAMATARPALFVDAVGVARAVAFHADPVVRVPPEVLRARYACASYGDVVAVAQADARGRWSSARRARRIWASPPPTMVRATSAHLLYFVGPSVPDDVRLRGQQRCAGASVVVERCGSSREVSAALLSQRYAACTLILPAVVLSWLTGAVRGVSSLRYTVFPNADRVTWWVDEAWHLPEEGGDGGSEVTSSSASSGAGEGIAGNWRDRPPLALDPPTQ